MNKIVVLITFLLFVGCDNANKSSSKNETGHNHETATTKSYYTCSMHPQIKQDGPGKCPICHMNLTKVEVDEDEGTISTVAKVAPVKWQCENFPDVISEKEDVCPIDGTPMIKVKNDFAGEVIGKVKLRKAQLSHFKPDVFPVTSMMMTKKVRLLGTVLQSEDRESNIPARIGGRVEKIFIESTGSFVKLGEPVIELYSPKLITAGEEYLIAKKSYLSSKSKEFKEMLEQSAERLEQWGIQKFQYENWYKNQKVPRNIKIYSSATGIVRKRNVVVGKYFQEGQNLFELSDLSEVWVEMDVYEHDSALVQNGQNVKLEFTALPGDIFEGSVDFVNPVLDPTSRTLKVRTTIKNGSGKLKPGMVADAILVINLEGQPLVIPRSAVIDTGKRKIVWTKISEKQFQAKNILVGQESEGYVEVKNGLMEGEEVVIEGNFLLDAQAQLFGGYEDMK